MSADIIDTKDGILVVRISGKLASAELAAVQQRAAEIAKAHRRLRILVLAEDFEGWEKAGNWGDLSFQMENDQYIERMALVGEKKWAALALLFTAKGLRKFPIEFFPPDAVAEARAWLASSG